MGPHCCKQKHHQLFLQHIHQYCRSYITFLINCNHCYTIQPIIHEYLNSILKIFKHEKYFYIPKMNLLNWVYLPGFRLTGFLPILGLLMPSSLLYGICLSGGEGLRQEVDQVECVTIAVLAFVNKLILGCDVEIYKNLQKK